MSMVEDKSTYYSRKSRGVCVVCQKKSKASYCQACLHKKRLRHNRWHSLEDIPAEMANFSTLDHEARLIILDMAKLGREPEEIVFTLRRAAQKISIAKEDRSYITRASGLLAKLLSGLAEEESFKKESELFINWDSED